MKELPSILEQDKEVQDLILRLSKERFAEKEKTEDRFDKILREIAADREAQIKKWAEQARLWNENNKRLAENVKRWDENDKRWAEDERKWQENQQIIRDILESIKVLNRKHEQSIGALGARWWLRAEQAFRNALKGILGEVTKLEVINKAVFYQKKHNRKAQRLMVISPMIDKKASELARDLGIQTYSYVEDIEPNAFSVWSNALYSYLWNFCTSSDHLAFGKNGNFEPLLSHLWRI